MITISNIRYIDIDHLVGVTSNRVVEDGKYFKVQQNIEVELSNGDIITIPEEFRSDGSSAPKYLWWIFPSYGAFMFASVIHDYLYHIDYMREELGCKKSQKFCDYEMYIWSKVLYYDTWGQRFDTNSRYKAVRLLGKRHYLK